MKRRKQETTSPTNLNDDDSDDEYDAPPTITNQLFQLPFMTSKQAIAQLESWSMEDTKEQEIQNEQKRYDSKIEKIEIMKCSNCVTK